MITLAIRNRMPRYGKNQRNDGETAEATVSEPRGYRITDAERAAGAVEESSATGAPQIPSRVSRQMSAQVLHGHRSREERPAHITSDGLADLGASLLPLGSI